MNRLTWICSLLACLLLSFAPNLLAATSRKAIETIRAVGPEGQGNADASKAWQQLAQSDATALVDILKAMDGANPLALNWLRSAVDTIAGRELSAGNKLPVVQLEKFLNQKSQHPRARRLAYELIAQS